MTASEISDEKSLGQLDDWRAVVILEAVHKYGAITKGEAAYRVGENASVIALRKLVDQKLLTLLNGGASADPRTVYGLSDRAKRLFGEGMGASDILEGLKVRRGR